MSHPQYYPRPPNLHGELILDVFTHKSLRQHGVGGDNERYATLGEKVFEAAVTNCIFRKYPLYGRKEIEEERAKQLSDQNYEQWTNFYRFRDKLRYSETVVSEVNSVQVTREVFHAYVGAVYTQVNGPSEVNTWAYHLITPAEDVKQEFLLPQLPKMPPPPIPPQLRNMNVDDPRDSMPYNAPANGKSIYLPRFNEITTQRRLSVQYPAEQRGLQHAPRWVVKCIVDGTELGIGQATTKQLAKEEAARQAFLALKFTMPGS
ncbi:hypothetical protein K439DRAFT_1419211 [Ramaria rubella]|nr:hypothetical protein K439DRAFT_1419211 [Ramaria rubella]